MNSIDLKSLIIGIFSCALVFMLMGLSIGTNQKYQIACPGQSVGCAVLNTDTGISKYFLPKDFSSKEREIGMMMYGEKPDF
ncbi:uncharacterized protein METZ01_LOCUS360336 [marine metagenome]|uniref:Uncharacterized protein n=1 Tax=marine metagenome TaxID=408172 RepID=A0A382SD54_9ZZZZ